MPRSLDLMRWMLIAIPAVAVAVTPLSYEQEIERWRAEREQRLLQPQGWLSLVGLHWLEPGTHRVGRAEGNDIVLATGPDELGTLRLEGGHAWFAPARDVAVTVGEAQLATEIELHADSSDTPTTLGVDHGQVTVQLIERGGRYGLRVRDARARTRSAFAGIEHYAIHRSWRMEARFEPHPPGKTIAIANVIGQLQPMANPGALRFERDGKGYALEAVDEGDGKLFVIFSDRTNGRETYGAGRFLYAEPAVDGRTVLDFNQAYNPPCAFNAYSTCPLPPPENRLDLAVTAGEKKYAGPTH